MEVMVCNGVPVCIFVDWVYVGIMAAKMVFVVRVVYVMLNVTNNCVVVIRN